MRMQIARPHRSFRALARMAGAATVALAVAAGAACTSHQLDGSSPSYLIVDALDASSGNDPQQFSGLLRSDVRGRCGGIWADNLRANLRVALKDPGSSSSPNQPSTTNLITVTRYSVRFVRADGRNGAGVDVPYGFDGGITITATPNGSEQIVTLVRVQSKIEAPLSALAVNLNSIATIAEVTFYGHDQAGRAVSVTGTIGVEFANWADDEECEEIDGRGQHD